MMLPLPPLEEESGSLRGRQDPGRVFPQVAPVMLMVGGLIVSDIPPPRSQIFPQTILVDSYLATLHLFFSFYMLAPSTQQTDYWKPRAVHQAFSFYPPWRMLAVTE